MARITDRFTLSHTTPGTTRQLLVHTYGRGNRGKVAYLQASLHADETPAMLALHHLIPLLDAADAAGQISGEIRLVPYANPIGLSQFVSGHHLGRYHNDGGENFNRGWPDLYDGLPEKVGDKLGGDASANVSLVRAALRELVAEREPTTELESLRFTLARQAVDADYVFDLHCDDDALMHLYLIPAHWPQGAGLAAELGCRAVMLAADSGSGPFDECFSVPWTRLQAAFPQHPIPAACFGGTVELRGQADVSDELARADAQALFRTLQREGLIAGDPGEPPAPLCEATDLAACEIVHAPAAGIVSYEAELGAQVKKGQTIAWLIDPAAEEPTAARQAVKSGTDGLVLSRSTRKYVSPGESLAKVVGTEPLADRKAGALLEA